MGFWPTENQKQRERPLITICSQCIERIYIHEIFYWKRELCEMKMLRSSIKMEFNIFDENNSHFIYDDFSRDLNHLASKRRDKNKNLAGKKHHKNCVIRGKWATKYRFISFGRYAHWIGTKTSLYWICNIALYHIYFN